MTEAPTGGEPPEQSDSADEPDEPVASASEAEHPAPKKEDADELHKPADERKNVMEKWK